MFSRKTLVLIILVLLTTILYREVKESNLQNAREKFRNQQYLKTCQEVRKISRVAFTELVLSNDKPYEKLLTFEDLLRALNDKYGRAIQWSPEIAPIHFDPLVQQIEILLNSSLKFVIVNLDKSYWNLGVFEEAQSVLEIMKNYDCSKNL